MFTGRTPVKSRYRKHDLVSFGLLCIYPHADALIKRHESRCCKTRSEDNLVMFSQKAYPVRFSQLWQAKRDKSVLSFRFLVEKQRPLVEK